jgi:hypothetical protein
MHSAQARRQGAPPVSNAVSCFSSNASKSSKEKDGAECCSSSGNRRRSNLKKQQAVDRKS